MSAWLTRELLGCCISGSPDHDALLGDPGATGGTYMPCEAQLGDRRKPAIVDHDGVGREVESRQIASVEICERRQRTARDSNRVGWVKRTATVHGCRDRHPRQQIGHKHEPSICFGEGMTRAEKVRVLKCHCDLACPQDAPPHLLAAPERMTVIDLQRNLLLRLSVEPFVQRPGAAKRDL